MSERKRETFNEVIADYFNDVRLMLSRELPWPTPNYIMVLLTRVMDAVNREGGAK